MTSPMAKQQYLYDDDDLADRLDDDDFENDDVSDNDYSENDPENDDYAENDDPDDYPENDDPPVMIVPVHTSLTTSAIEIVRLPAKGITAWLAHLQRKERRDSIMDKLRSLVF